MDIPVRDMFRELSTVDVENMYVTSRMDWRAVDLSFDARTERGATYLQTFYPGAPLGDLAKEIDISDCHSCILGMLWGGYSRSLEDCLYGLDFCVAHGFAGHMGRGYTAILDEKLLTGWWREALIGRHPGATR